MSLFLFCIYSGFHIFITFLTPGIFDKTKHTAVLIAAADSHIKIIPRVWFSIDEKVVRTASMKKGWII